MSDLMVKISKILNQAERASTPEEADAFLSMAQVLSTKHSIDLAVARAHTAKIEQVERPEKRKTTFADAGKNNKKHFVNLYSAIASNNDVRMDIAHNSTYVIGYGFPSDIDVVEALFAHLCIQMVEAANAYIKSGEYKSETTTSLVRKKVYDSEWGDHYDRRTGEYYRWEEEYVTKPVDGRVARSSFYVGYVSAISCRLLKARTEAETAAEVEQTGTALVLVDKRKSVADFYSGASNARGSWSGSSSSAMSSSGMRSGRASGERARLSGQTAMTGGRKAING